MSFFRALFGGGKKEEKKEIGIPPANSQSLAQAIQNNRDAIDTLEKRQQLLEKKIAEQVEDAKHRVAAGDKRGALLVLKRKKLLEGELEKLMNSHMTLEQQILSLESAQTSQMAVSALQQGIAAQKNISTIVSIDQVDQLMEDMQEQQELQNEIAQVLSQGARVTDDAQLMEELEMMQAEELEKKLANVPAAVAAKTVTTSSIAAPSSRVSLPAGTAPILSQDEEAELAALQAGLH